MPRRYYQLLPYTFRRFSVLSACRTLLPTIGYHLTRRPLSQSDKPALFTMNILPPMMTVWYHCARKYLGKGVDIVIFDCSGKLDAREFPGARVQKYVNRYASTKSDEFLYHIAQKRKIGWICDDDVFFVNPEAVDVVTRELTEPNTASVSFRNRNWWHFTIDGKTYPVSGSYCTALNRSIYCDREHLSLAPAGGNQNPPDPDGKQPKRYDTFDLANETLLKKGYRCVVIPEAEQSNYIASFSGLSGAVMLLNYFKTPEQTLAYFREPEPEEWKGSLLFGLFSAMLAVQTIQECYTHLTGHPYPLPSLPSKQDLAELRRDRESILGGGRSFQWIDDASTQLKAAL